MRKILVSGIILLIIVSFAGCIPKDGYRATKYLNLQTNNPQSQLLTIGGFTGEKTDQWEFVAASRITVECELGKGSITIALYDPNDKLILEQEVESEEAYRDVIDGQFISGVYKFKITSRGARNIQVNVEFHD